MVANPAAGTWVVHSEKDGFAQRLRAQGALGVFANLPVTLPGASGCFYLPVARHALSTERTSKPEA